MKYHDIQFIQYFVFLMEGIKSKTRNYFSNLLDIFSIFESIIVC